jgi:hypothetical protein
MKKLISQTTTTTKSPQNPISFHQNLTNFFIQKKISNILFITVISFSQYVQHTQTHIHDK